MSTHIIKIVKNDHLIDRFGGVVTLLVGEFLELDPHGRSVYIDVVMSPGFSKEHLPLAPQLGYGDEIEIFAPDNGHETAVCTRIIKIGQTKPPEYCKCPRCQSGLIYGDQPYCMNPSCPGRLASRICFFGTPDGIGCEWLTNYDLIDSLVRTGHIRSMAGLFSAIEWESIPMHMCPRTTSAAVWSAMSSVIHSFQSPFSENDLAQRMAWLLHALSIPGLRRKDIMGMAHASVTTDNPFNTMREFFRTPEAFQYLLRNEPEGVVYARYLHQHVQPFAREIDSIFLNMDR